MGKSLSELSAEATQAAVAWMPADKIPDEYMPTPPPPQPGYYEFRLPKNMSGIWEEIDRANVQGKRIQAEFSGDAALVITRGGGLEGDPFECRINNAERNRARRGEPEVLVSDGTYLLRALGYVAPTKTNAEWAKALMAQAGKVFGANLTWSWNCNPKREARGVLPSGEVGELVDGNGQKVMGCGATVYQEKVQRDPETGGYPLYIRCPTCANRGLGTEIRAFANLRGFVAASTQEKADDEVPF